MNDPMPSRDELAAMHPANAMAAIRHAMNPTPARDHAQVREAKMHNLKIWPQYFEAVLSGDKTFEWRKDDRDYRVGDTLRLREWLPELERYTGRELIKRISYILRGNGFPEGYAVLALAASPPEGREVDANRTTAQDLGERIRAMSNDENRDVQNLAIAVSNIAYGFGLIDDSHGARDQMWNILEAAKHLRATPPVAQEGREALLSVRRECEAMLSEVPFKHSGTHAEDLNRCRNLAAHRIIRHIDVLLATPPVAPLPPVVTELLSEARRYIHHRDDEGFQCAEHRDGPDTCDCGATRAWNRLTAALARKEGK